ncbi:MAG: sensor histidine kinase [Chloroflexota bacterium]
MKTAERSVDLLPGPRAIALLLLVALAMYGVARNNYLLFHTTAEGFGIVVGGLIYVVGSRSYRYSGNDFLLFLADAFLFVTVIDFLHMMTYQGMGILPGYGPNAPTQLWIAERYLAAISLCLSPLFIYRKYPRALFFSIYAVVTAALIASVLGFRNFPDSFVEGKGLTTFKVVSEYVVSLFALIGIVLLHRHRKEVDHSVYLLVMAAMVLTVATELSFTLYTDVYGVMNFVGHMLELGSFYLVFLVVASRGIDAPYREVMLLNRDLEKRVAERTRQLESANRELEREIVERKRAEQSREEYTSLISHDLRNPLTAIRGHAELLSRLLTRQGLQREAGSADSIVKSSNRMNSMIQDMVETVRLESGQLELRRQPTDLHQLLAEIADRVASPENRTRLQLECPEDLPVVSVDPDQIERAVVNLITNALKYSPEDSPVLIQLWPEGDEVRLSIVDRGVGVPEEESPRIFERFYRARTGRRAEGLGLGLYITRLIVEAHGGRLDLQSGVGKGSTFRLSLPVGEGGAGTEP